MQTPKKLSNAMINALFQIYYAEKPTLVLGDKGLYINPHTANHDNRLMSYNSLSYLIAEKYINVVDGNVQVSLKGIKIIRIAEQSQRKQSLLSAMQP